VVLEAGRAVRASLTFDAGLLKAIDAEATKRGLTRSAFLASAARERLELARVKLNYFSVGSLVDGIT
jgi:hypothetical protein